MFKKKSWFIVLFFTFFWACNDGTPVGNTTPPAPNTNPSGTVQKGAGVFYADEFRVPNSSAYETLLKVCGRCGTRRIFNTPGGTTYQRYWVSDSDPKKCRNWISTGYLQIHFEEKKLPTKATVSIRPYYTGVNSGNTNFWGVPFSVKAIANPINENQGFEILVRPREGLGGVQSLVIQSEYSNHVLNDQLELLITYGQQNSQTVVSGSITKRASQSLNAVAYDCDTYTN